MPQNKSKIRNKAKMPGKKDQMQRSPVSRPLSPTRLTELKVLGKFPKPDPDFDPQKGFTHKYDLWMTYGHVPHSENRVVGGVVLKKSDPVEGRFKINLVQTYGNAEDVVHTLTATAICKHDLLALPMKWTLTSGFSRTKATWKGVQKNLTSTYAVEGEKLVVRINGQANARKLPGTTTSDWTLFEAIQRMPAKPGFEATFNVLEGLSVLRPEHRIIYKELVTHQWGGEQVKLHYYRQFGQGMLPYEYYLDERHRLVMVVSGYRAYVLQRGNA